MELNDMVLALRRGWKRIVLVTTAALLVGAAVATFLPRQYESTARLYVKPDRTASVAVANAENRAESFAALASSDVLVRQVIDELGLDVSPTDFLEAVSADVEAGTSVLSISVRDRSANTARLVAQTMSETFIQYLVLVAGGRDVTPQALAEAQTAPATSTAPAHIVQPADEPGPPVAPSTPTILAASAAIGLLLSGGSLVLRELRRRPVHAARDVSAQDERVTVLGLVPTDPRAPHLAPSDDASDAFRRVAATLDGTVLDEVGGRIVLSGCHDVPSAVLAAQLAHAVAETGRRTVLVDADLRTKMLTRLTDTTDAPGLAEAVHGGSALHSMSRPDGVLLVPAGTTDPAADPGAIVASPRLDELLGKATPAGGATIVVTPPIAQHAEAAVLGRDADLLVIAVELGRTGASALRAAVDAALAVGIARPAVLLVDSGRRRRTARALDGDADRVRPGRRRG